ncbi:hypothetical protein SLUN_21175 [Streptomyces lunaelactis]|uniref:Uncharacterized protein n=1 Tax=Streptomyces lunaelactis TaxID=1535768 RepID=A0A2R4T581_9ACTN|nr:hypothetical protein [Streptomyces lunaelactis]AVZ74295.1 hypothetical protein SLUN_21175 [Streptomyces lunaelactis]NUK85742.1 hypothetical protein [Streptomyces lunaelactis]
MAEDAPVIVHPVSPDGGRRVTIRGEAVGVASNLFDLLEFLRRADLPEADTAIDDPELIEWRGGGPETWGEPTP